MLQDIFETLSAVKDPYLWGAYAVSKDILRKRVQEAEKQDMIGRAYRCGQEFAEQMRQEYSGFSIKDIMKEEGIRVVSSGDSLIGERLLFAQFTPPNEVMIMEEPLMKYEILLKREGLSGILPAAEEVCQLLLGHELFHYLEEKYKDIIYTRKRKIQIWKFWKFTGHSTLRALSELAAMYFSQALNGVTYSPFILDVLLFYSYDKKAACEILDDMMQTIFI